jgi:hypothetical protein
MLRNTKLPSELTGIVDRMFLIEALKRLEEIFDSVDDQVSSLLADVEPLATSDALPPAYREAYATIVESLSPLAASASAGISTCRQSRSFRAPFDTDPPVAPGSNRLAEIARHHIEALNSAEKNLLEKTEEAHSALKARHPDAFFDWEGFPSGLQLSVVMDPGEARSCYANRDDGLMQLRMREYTPFLTPGDDRESFVPGEGHPLQGCRIGRLVNSLVGTSPILYRSVDEHSPLPWQLLPLLHKVEVQILSITDKTLWMHGFGNVTDPIDLSCGCTFDGRMFRMGRMPPD